MVVEGLAQHCHHVRGLLWLATVAMVVTRSLRTKARQIQASNKESRKQSQASICLVYQESLTRATATILTANKDCPASL